MQSVYLSVIYRVSNRISHLLSVSEFFLVFSIRFGFVGTLARSRTTVYTYYFVFFVYLLVDLLVDDMKLYFSHSYSA